MFSNGIMARENFVKISPLVKLKGWFIVLKVSRILILKIGYGSLFRPSLCLLKVTAQWIITNTNNGEVRLYVCWRFIYTLQCSAWFSIACPLPIFRSNSKSSPRGNGPARILLRHGTYNNEAPNIHTLRFVTRKKGLLYCCIFDFTAGLEYLIYMSILSFKLQWPVGVYDTSFQLLLSSVGQFVPFMIYKSLKIS
jgi:hypothetical protein